MPTIHPTAIVDPAARVADDARIGAYAIVGPRVEIGAGSVVHEHSVLHGPTVIGQGCQIGPAAYVGLDPQHLRFVPNDENPTWLIIGDHCIIRETASLHRASKPGRENATQLGHHCFLMGASHVGHDCVLGNHVIMANGALLGGHCVIGDNVFLGGGAVFHQFSRVGRLAIVGGNQAISRDVPPFGAVWDARLKGYNAVGCRRASVPMSTIRAIRSSYNLLREHRLTSRALEAIAAEVPDLSEVRELVAFVRASKRGILPSRDVRREDSEAGGE